MPGSAVAFAGQVTLKTATSFIDAPVYSKRGRIFSKTEEYSAKVNIQQSGRIFSKAEEYSAKVKNIQQSGRIFSKTEEYSAKTEEYSAKVKNIQQK